MIPLHSFFNMIIALGGKCSSDHGDGSHRFVSLVLGEFIVDNDVMEDEQLQDLTAKIVRKQSKAGSKGTMTLAWPPKNHGFNRRFLTPLQVENARLIMAENGFIPEVIARVKAKADEAGAGAAPK